MRNAVKSGRRAARRGFTLVELMAAVAIVGVLAALALVGYKKYINSAQASEATSVISAIRVSEEAYKAETLSYFTASTNLGTSYPTKTPNSRKNAWVNPTHSDYAKWKTLNVVTDGPVRFGYSVVAGDPGTNLPTDTALSTQPAWPATAVNSPWYVVQAVGDRDDNGIKAVFVGSSITGEIMSENASE